MECEICHEKINYFYHTFLPWQVTVEPTETTEGVRVQVCSACGYERSEILSTVSHVHQFGEWRFTIFPSKDSKGEIIRECNLNKEHFETYELPVLNVTFYRYHLLEEANCEKEGVEVYSFVKDGQTLEIKQIISRQDHTFEEKWSSNAFGHWHASTCIHEGIIEDFGGHDYNNGYCRICNYKEPEEEHIHTFGKWEVIQSPTTNSLGDLIRICLTNTEHFEFKKLPVLNTKEYDYKVTKASTCSDEGTAEYRIVVDEQELVFEVSLPLSDHPYEEKWSTNNQYHWHAATCFHTEQKKEYDAHTFENGKCKVCNYIGYSEGLSYELNEDMISYKLTGLGSSTDKNIVIPAIYQGLPVTKINYSVFQNYTSLESIRISSGVEEIGDSCFQGCTNLKIVELPDTLKKLGTNCFASCNMLENIELPQSLEILGDTIWKDCKNLKSIVFPSSLTIVGSQLVQGCSNLEYYEYDNALYLGNQENPYLLLVQANDTLISSCTIHEDTRFICSQAFAECISLKNIIIPNQVISIGNSCFNYCSGLEYVILSKAVSSIGRSAFSGCNNLKYVYYMGSE
ncbi:MAG: leucine-rich repeat domain-containing protein, partial [Anaeroplasmataceae bacterium]|nr:leucine-rich repeat domain-containing protein [Anaeroplasmataceae bacterium]